MTGQDAHAQHRTPPLARGRVIVPLLVAYRESGQSIENLLAEFDLSLSELGAPNCFVPHDTVYAVFEAVAQKTSPDFPALVGQTSDPTVSSPFGQAFRTAKSLADFIARFCLHAGNNTNAVTMTLDVSGEFAVLSARRRFTPRCSPAYMDAFQISRWATLLHDTAGQRWEANKVLVRVNRPDLLPSYFYGVRAVGAGPDGYSIRFPSAWLLFELVNRTATEYVSTTQDEKNPVPTDLLSSIQSVANSMVGRTDLSVTALAKACGFRGAALNRRLSAYGTSLSRIAIEAKCDRAKHLLSEAEISVGDIAAQLGYSDATAMTRAFKNWTGQTPSEFRAREMNSVKASVPILDPVECDCET
ncbi:helix-turn-helix domain-containing protein [Rhodobacteraceae bacterium B1Z28]|uniref:Helix-turn-helix domain-containing protein n=1 Tax=Ruegeria haliotis TaxID=2747601 RepID=A0ABX2PRT9_9RHOB|nr:AraC family transcriptional regulator [Ruegeria haliotis]NVO56880.1 helix-turn-helix domain-containing protein [Ruegeria haliotis]